MSTDGKTKVLLTLISGVALSWPYFVLSWTDVDSYRKHCCLYASSTRAVQSFTVCLSTLLCVGVCTHIRTKTWMKWPLT